MEFLLTQSGPNKSSLTQSFDNAVQQKVGLLILSDDVVQPSEEAPIVLKTRNLTHTLIETDMMTTLSSNSDAVNDDESSVEETLNPQIKPCIFYSHYQPRIFSCGPNRRSLVEISHHLDSAARKALPKTKCLKHGTSGFLPFDYVRKLPEYTCSIHRHPVFKVVHSFDDCILEFPIAHPIGSSKQHFHEGFLMRKYCYQCFKKLSTKNNLYMFRDTLFCSSECRCEASVTRYWYKKMMKALDKNLRSIAVSSMDGRTIFTILP